jgi:hypothetical protein
MAGAATGVLELSYQCSAPVTRMRFVSLTGDQTVAQHSVPTTSPLGVARLSVDAAGVTAGKGPAVQVLGVAFIEAGAAFAIGAELSGDATGRAITAIATHRVAARALKAATAAGQWIPCLLLPSGRVV